MELFGEKARVAAGPAALAVQTGAALKAACGLGLLDTGFDSSLLTYFRRRLGRSEDPNRLFSAVRQVVAATGVLAGKHRRALDSTVLDDAVATQDTVTQLIAAVRRVIREVPGAAEVAGRWCTAHDYRDPGKPKIAWDDEAARAALVDALVTDALNLLEHLPEQALGGQAADAVGLLALVAGQDVEPAEGSDGSDGRWRIARRTATDRVISAVDPQARHIHKNRTRHQDGFKGHVSFEPEAGLFTAVALTAGSGAGNHEAAVAATLLAGEQEELTVLGDTAYGTGELREHLQAAGHTAVIKPPPLRPAVPGGFTVDDFTVDDQACPAGRTVALGRPQADGNRAAPVQNTLPQLPAAPALHHLQGRARFTSIPSTPCWPPPARPPPLPPGRTNTASGGPRSSGPSPGSSPAATAASPTGASPRTTPGSTTGPPPSTSAA